MGIAGDAHGRCWGSGCAPSSWTGRPAPLDDTAVLDIGVQDTGPDGALWALALRGVEEPARRRAGHRLDRPRCPARLPPGRPARGRRRHRAVLRRRRGQAHLRRGQAAEGRRASRTSSRSTPSPHAMRVDRHRADGQGRDVHAAHRGDGRALPALLPAVRRDPPLRAAVPARGAARRARAAARHLAAGPAADPGLRAGRDGARAARRRPRRTCGCSDRPPRSSSPATSTPRSRTCRPTGPRTSSRWTSTASGAGSWPPTPTGWTPIRRRSPGCSARSTCSCRPGTGRCWSTDPAHAKDLWRDPRPPGRRAGRRRDRRHLAGAQGRQRR